jgi:O-acetyl-ADP-ribose deacetylase (regulator of RNase III)
VPAKLLRGDIFDSGAAALVSPVNTTGVQGKGLALEFRRRYPEACSEFRRWCEPGRMQPGDVWTHLSLTLPRIIFAATKDDWRQPSRLEWIAAAMDGICLEVQRLHLASVAVCALGCGLGGLKWADVRPIMLAKAERMSALVMIYEPG